MNRQPLRHAAVVALTLGAGACVTDDARIASSNMADEATAMAETNPSDEAEGTSLNQWSPDVLRRGWRAEALIDEAEVVSGITGQTIGDVENMIIGPDGRVLSLIAEIGGTDDVGDKHVSVPWEQVELVADVKSVIVPISEENITDYSLFAPERGYIARPDTSETQPVPETLETGPRVWKATELIHDYVFTEDGSGYGYIDDLIFDGGMLQAVVIDTDVVHGPPYGTYALPWHGSERGFVPGQDRYELPYDAEEVAQLEPFDYEGLAEDVDD